MTSSYIDSHLRTSFFALNHLPLYSDTIFSRIFLLSQRVLNSSRDIVPSSNNVVKIVFMFSCVFMFLYKLLKLLKCPDIDIVLIRLRIPQYPRL